MRRVLIIDDYAPIVEMLALWCRAMGFEPIEATNGLAGLARVEEGGVDVVLVDVDMPGVDGPSVCRAIRGSEEWAGLRVVLMSGRAQWELAMLAADCGASAWVSKPFDWERLAGVLAREAVIDRDEGRKGLAGEGVALIEGGAG